MSEVTLHVYDLSGGMAKQYSQQIIGKEIKAIYHTGVCVYGKEYYFGGLILNSPPGRSPYGTPMEVKAMGQTSVTLQGLEAHLKKMADTQNGGKFGITAYNVLSNNCNNFSNELCKHLVGKGIPEEIINLPQEFLNTPLGQAAGPFIQQIQSGIEQQLPRVSPYSKTRQHLYGAEVMKVDKGNPGDIVKKIKQLNAKAGYYTGDDLARIDRLVEYKESMEMNVKQLKDLEDFILQLNVVPVPSLYPSLDLLRLLVLSRAGNYVIRQGNFMQVLQHLLYPILLEDDEAALPSGLLLTSLRLFVNAFLYQGASTIIQTAYPLGSIYDIATKYIGAGNVHCRVLSLKLVYNLSLFTPRHDRKHILPILQQIFNLLQEKVLQDKAHIQLALTCFGKFLVGNPHVEEMMQEIKYDPKVFEPYHSDPIVPAIVQEIEDLRPSRA